MSCCTPAKMSILPGMPHSVEVMVSQRHSASLCAHLSFYFLAPSSALMATWWLNAKIVPEPYTPLSSPSSQSSASQSVMTRSIFFGAQNDGFFVASVTVFIGSAPCCCVLLYNVHSPPQCATSISNWDAEVVLWSYIPHPPMGPHSCCVPRRCLRFSANVFTLDMHAQRLLQHVRRQFGQCLSSGTRIAPYSWGFMNSQYSCGNAKRKVGVPTSNIYP